MGVKQEGPLSPYIFILCAAILAIQLKGKKIKGIANENFEVLLTQYADDITEETLNELHFSKNISGFEGTDEETNTLI